MVYCKMGLMTRTSAGMTPANREVAPSSRMRDIRVLIVEGAFFGRRFSPPGSVSASCFFLVVIRVLTTQIGFVKRTVAEPAIAPAIMLSTVVSFLLARPAFSAAFSKNARVHSYQ